MRPLLRLVWSVLFVLIASCGDDAQSTDGGTADGNDSVRCPAHAVRRGSGGAATCTCDDGFVKLASARVSACIDVDECISNAADCSPDAKCTNTEGSYECSCQPGFEGDGRSCKRPDACGDVTCTAPASCAVQHGAGVCVCPEGYSPSGNGCADVDECALGTADCADDARCANQDGGYDCTCNAGFDGDGKTCTARTECIALGLDCGEHAACTRHAGTIGCTCNDGYEGDGKTCSDVDECALHADDCDAAAICTNTAGSFSCACRAGFSGDGVHCADIDECARGTDNCNAAGEQCNNVAGSWRCSCAPGYKLINETCIGPDTTAPTCTISADRSRLRAGQTTLVTFALSESSSDFASGDLSVDGGSLGPLTGSGSYYTAIFTPLPNVALDARIALPAGRFSDVVGNPNLAAIPLTIAVDTQLPAIVLHSSASTLKAGQTATLTFTLNEAVSDFTLADVVASGGALSAFAGSDREYTALFTPVADMTVSATVDVAANAFTDAAGNANLAAAQLAIAVTTHQPTLTISSDDALLNVGDSAIITFTLTESASDFAAQDVTVGGGTLSGFSGSGASYTATLTPSASSTSPATVDVASAAFSNADGNGNVAAEQLVIDVDTIAPSALLGASDDALELGETSQLTITLSESASDFVEADLTVSGCSLSGFAGSGSSYTALLTPASDLVTTCTVDVAAAAFSDAAANANSAATTLNIAVDRIAPSVVIDSDDDALHGGESAALTFTLSEAASDFGAGDVSVSGGTLSAFAGSGTSYTATFTPSASSTEQATIGVAARSFSDAAGNANVVSTPLTIDVDTIAPTVAIGSDASTLKAGETAALTFTLSESALDFTQADVSVSGGTLSAFSGSGSSYSATFTPAAESTGSATITVNGAVFSDAAGNGNVASSTTTIAVDSLPPTIAISSDDGSLKIGDVATLTFTLSEAALDFDAADIAVTGGTLGSLNGSGASYSATFTPAASSTTSATVNVAAAGFTDAAGNDNGAAPQLTLAVDTVAPGVAIGSDDSSLSIGETATLTFTLSEASTSFTGAGIHATGGTLGAISGSGSSYSATFTPTSGIAANATVDLDAGSFSDLAGNANLAASQILIAVDTIAPAITISTDDSLLTIGEVATLTFSLSEAASDFAADDVVVSGGTLGVLSGGGTSYSASFTPTPSANLTATVDVAVSRFTDAAGNANLAASQLTITVATQPPCGDGVVAGGEQCDDAPPAENGDGCSATCTIESGFSCAGSPSICTTTCGDGIKASSEACDDAPPAENGDGCSATCTVELGFTCTGSSPSTCSVVCGDGITAGSEQCDDGCLAGTPGVCELADNGDGCSSTCTFECGNGVLAGNEQCDDSNRTAGDGCSSTCTFELSCGVGEDLVQVRSTDVPKAIPDDNVTGVDSNAVVPLANNGAVRKVMVGIGRITHTYDADLLVSLLSPSNRRRNLIANRGVNVQNFITTRLDDSAATAISAGTAPYSGAFRPEQTISDAAGYSGINAAGTWQLRAVDSGTGDVGAIVGWTLSLCVDPSVVCGNGFIEGSEECDDNNSVDNDACSNACTVTDGCGDGNLDAGEQCDDDNLVAGDGCSATCQVDITCGAGETTVIVNNNASFAIPDSTPAGILSPVTVAQTGAVRRASVYVRGITHTDDGDVDMFLMSPGGTQRELSTDNVSGGQNYARTSFDDGAASVITTGTAPFSGRYRGEQSLSTTAGTDFRELNAAGTWNLHVIDDAAGDTGTLDSWFLALCVDASAAYCGDSVKNGSSEECDDGNLVGTDTCNNLCQLVDGCGDGNLDAGEECDDDNLVSGDGCSATCTLDITCGAGEVPVVLRNSTSTPIPDNAGGVLSAINVALPGVVRKVIPSLSISHAVDAQLDVFLISPYGVQRELSTDQSGVNYVATSFSDAAATAVTASSAPYTGTVRSEQTISSAAPGGFANQTATGSWSLRVSDDTVGTTGTLNSWSLALCLDPSVASVCGNGIVELSETCDDGNNSAGDGCSSSCALEISCPFGTTPVITRSNTAGIIPDNSGGGFSSTLVVSASGVVTKAVLLIGALSHANDAHVDASLISPAATAIDVSSDNGGTGDDYVSTIIDDAAATAITAGVAPFRGRFQPEATLATVNGQAASGTWTFKVVDDTAGDAGVLGGWTLALCVQDD